MSTNMAPNRRPREPLFDLAVLGLVALSAAASLTACTPRSPDAAPASASASIGGPFHLVDQSGAPRDERLLRGHWTVVFFGYTYCPDVCPTTLQALARAEDDLGPDARRLQVVFVTVDPARDTPHQLAAYLSSDSFPKGVIGLTGTADQVAQAAKAYRVYYARNGTGSSYTVDHTAVVYLMDPQGRFAQPLDTTAPPPRIAADLKKAMAAG